MDVPFGALGGTRTPDLLVRSTSLHTFLQYLCRKNLRFTNNYSDFKHKLHTVHRVYIGLLSNFLSNS